MAYSSTLHQSNPSLYTTKCLTGCFPEPSVGALYSLWGLEDSYPPSFDAKLLHGDQDFMVPETSPDTNLLYSDDHHHHHPHGHGSGLELIPPLPEYCNVVDYLSSGGGLDGLLGFNALAYHQMNATDIGEEASVVGLGFTSAAPYHLASNNGGSWQGIQSHKSHVENMNSRVGRYSVEERRDRIHRYLKKRNQRNFNKTIKYACRKTLADRRARVRGRFAKNNEEAPADDHFKPNKVTDGREISPHSYYDYANHDYHQMQKKEEGEELLQEAIASLMMYNMASPYPYHHLPQHRHLQGSLPLQ